MQNAVIETNNLRKEYGDKVAVESLSLSINRGEVFGFIGPNGAGKTTSIKMFLGLVSPTEGSGSLLGQPLGNAEARKKAGFLPEHFRFHAALTGREFLHFHAGLYNLPTHTSQQRIPELLELVGLSAHGNRKLQEYSKGMLQRIGLAQALLNEPEVVFLDEPTSGLDPVGRIHVRTIIQNLRQSGATVFLNSHLLSEVEVTCDRVAFIRHGRVVKTCSLDEYSGQEILLEIKARPMGEEVVSSLERWGKVIEIKEDWVRLSIRNEDMIPEINRSLLEQGCQVYGLTPRHSSLEELFIEMFGDEGGL